MKKRVVVVCPGRGTYTRETLGYLRQNGSHAGDFLRALDERRELKGEPSITALDFAETFDVARHTRGENASTLIYACARADFLALDRERYEVVAITGNSMGWYLALAMGESLDDAGAFHLIDTMGGMMRDEIVGGQLIYPVTNADWRPSSKRRYAYDQAVARAAQDAGAAIYPSIHLGGYEVLGANAAGLKALKRELPAIDNYPFQLVNHAAFHTPLMKDTAARAFDLIKLNLFKAPRVPLVDGRGHVWTPWSSAIDELYRYTLGHQVVEPYDFSRAVAVALREFAPDHLVLLGPGASLGGSLGQILVAQDWLGLKNKAAFATRQAEEPFVLSMGRPDQRALVARAINALPSES